MKISIKHGLLLSFITMIIYYIFYYIYKEDINYFLGFIFINCFIMTFLYALYALLLAYYIKYYSSYNYFIIPFITLCISGTLSLSIIFLFFNYLDTKSLLVLKKGIIENCFNKYKYDIIKEYGFFLYKKRLLAINNGNIFNYWIFLIYLFFCILYYLIICLLIFMFFKQKNNNIF